MGALTPVTTLLSGVTTALNTIDNFSTSVQSFGTDQAKAERAAMQKQQELALKQLQASQKISEQQALQDAALEREKLAIDAQTAEQTRQRALRRTVAKQRALFGGSGTGATGGSAEAVLLGLFEESDEERAQAVRLNQLKTSALDQGLAQQSSLNLLQAQQLRERQRLERAIRF